MLKRSGTPVDKLIPRILTQDQFTSHVTEWELAMNHVLFKHISLSKERIGYPELVVCKAGFIINPLYPFIGGSHDAAVYDPSTLDKPIWIFGN